MKKKPSAIISFLALFFLTACAVAQGLAESVDFHVYYQAALALRDAGWQGVYILDSLTPFKYHPILVWFFLPWSFFPWVVAKWLWVLFNVGIALGVFHRMKRLFGATSGETLAAFFCVIHGLTWQLKLGNVSLLMLWLVLFAATAGARARVAGVAALIGFKFTWGAAFLPLVLARKYRDIFTVVLILLFCTLAVAFAAGSEPYMSWWHALSDPSHAHNYPKNDSQSWFAFCYRFFGENSDLYLWWGIGSLVYAVIFTLLCLKSRVRDFAPLLIASALLWLWASPLSWIHNQILLAPYFLGLIVYLRKKYLSVPGVVFALSWFYLNGTGELFWGREGFTRVHQLSIPVLGFVFLLFLLPRFLVAAKGKSIHR